MRVEGWEGAGVTGVNVVVVDGEGAEVGEVGELWGEGTGEMIFG